MKKILTTLAGTVALALGAGACSAVDTTETKSIAPVAAPLTSTAPVQSFKFDRRLDFPSRSATRPVKPVIFVKPGISHHQNHVNHVKLEAAAKAARIAKAKAAKAKVVKPVKKKVVKVKKVYKKTVKKTTKYVSSKSHRAPGGIAACIRKYESGGNYRAQNPSTTASGAYQFVNATWRAITGRSDRAKDAPPSVQDAAFYKLWAGGRGAHHWVVAHKCGY